MTHTALSQTLKKAKKLHFVGIGGISMSTLAILSRRAGYTVSGSDRAEGALVDRCRDEGCTIHLGHHAENVHGADVVIYTAAICDDSPELVEAKRLGIPAVSRAEFLGEIMKAYRIRIGISGTHGKTSTTSMIAHILIAAGLDPTVANGAVTPELGGAYRIGNREHFVYEACEYKASFHSFCPTIAVITNVELDHTDFYPSLDHVIAAFADSIKKADTVIVNGDDENALAAVRAFKGEVLTFSLKDPNASLYADALTYQDGKASYTAIYQGKALGRVTLPVIGAFNAANSLAALSAALCAGAEPDEALAALGTFRAANRRFEVKYKANGITVVDDYAHHPSEIAATLISAKRLSAKRIITVFQPHTYSRTHDLFDAFVKSLSLSDKVLLADIYAARESDTLGVSSALLAQAIGEKASAPGGFEALVQALISDLAEGDLILTMGAGDVYRVGDELIKRITNEENGIYKESQGK